MKYLKSAIRRILIATALITVVLAFLLMTTPGLHTLIKLAAYSLPGQLNIQQAEGSLTQGISFTQLTYVDPKLDMHVTRGNLAWEMTLNPWHNTLKINQVHIKKLHVHGSDISSPKPHHDMMIHSLPFDICINQLKIDELNIEQIKAHHVQFTASFRDFTWSVDNLKLRYKNHDISLQSHGELQKVYDLSAALSITPVSRLIDGVTGHINISGDKARYDWDGQFTGFLPIMVKGKLTNLNQLDTMLSMGMNRLTVNGDMPNLHMNAFIPKPEDLHPVLVDFKTTLNATGDIRGLQQGHFTMTISPGVFQLPKDSSIASIPFQGGKLSIILTPEALKATADFMFDANETINASLRLPEFDLQNAMSPEQRLDGSLHLQMNSLVFLKGLTPVNSNPHGQLSADLILTGSLGKPDVQGTLKLADGGLSLTEAGIILNPVQATLSSHNKRWNVEGSIGGGENHVISIKGNGEFLPSLTGAITISANDFPVLKTPEYTINVSPQLSIKLDKDIFDVNGVISIPTARFKPLVFSNTVNLTDDVVFVSNDSVKTPEFLHVKANVSVKIGNDVVVDAQGLHGVLGGEIKIIKPLGGSMTALGELTINEGSYKAYGQNLAINHGQLLFSGATPTNPKISLRAVRTFNNTSQFSGSNQLFDFNASNIQTIDFGNHITVGIDVGGRLNQPKIKLFSVPSSLSQADILSMLLLGKPASQASQSGGQLLLTAISAMNLDSGAQGVQLLSQLKQTLGFDFDVKSSSMSNQASNNAVGDTAFVVGKALSKRLYLSYSIGILQENSSVLILKYLLNKYFSVQVTASSNENGVDLLYSAQP